MEGGDDGDTEYGRSEGEVKVLGKRRGEKDTEVPGEGGDMWSQL